jgi:SAM-dependent methyltransferase
MTPITSSFRLPMLSPTTLSSGARAAPPPAAAAFPDLYERLLVAPLFRPWAEQLLDALPLAPGQRVLDVACGTGIVARLVRERLGERATIVAVDRSPAMLAVARAIEPAVEWREGDAVELPLGEDERFDVVLCHQGLQFFDDRLAAVRARRRALAPGGHVGIGVWRSLEENGLFHDLGRVAERVLGPVVDARHTFADADALARLLADAGFTDVRVTPSSRETRFAIDAAVLARLNATALVGRSEAERGLDDAERAAMITAIVDASLAEVARYREGGEIVFRTSANLATARA